MYTSHKATPNLVDDFQAWTKDNVGEGHTFVESSGLIVVNGSIDVSAAYLIHLRATDEEKLVQLLRTTKDLLDHDQDLHAVSHKQQRFIRDLHRSAGGRLRFRVHIGPTADGRSLLEQFIANLIRPTYLDGLPEFITEMSAQERVRLYDLANALARSPKLHRESITWAVEQNPTSISQLVNYTEYYVASRERLEKDIRKRSDEEFEAARADIQLSFDEITVVAVKVAQADAAKAARRRYTPLIGKMMRNQLTDEARATLSQLTGQDYSAQALSQNVKNARRAELLAAIRVKVEEVRQAAAEPTSRHREIAKERVRAEKEELLLETIRQNVRAQMEPLMLDPSLSSQFAAQREEASRTGFAGEAPRISGFWDQEDEEKINRIKETAASAKIPFMSDHAAVYHALKHYHELSRTCDSAENTGKSELESYFHSATKTIANPTEPVTSQASQFHNHPRFFFIRTVNKDPSFLEASDLRMRAIVVVGGKANSTLPSEDKVYLLTYFRAP
ncbi:MAG: hypothetical protein ACPGWR_23095 [Ardenticatenaceae bacterium]